MISSKIIRHVRGVEGFDNVEELVRKIAELGLDRPLAELYMLTGEEIPIFSYYHNVYLPIGRAVLPLPEHSVILFASPLEPRRIITVLEPYITNPSLLDEVRRYSNHRLRHVPATSTIVNTEANYRPILDEMLHILKRVGLRLPTVEWIEPLLPYLPDELVSYLEDQLVKLLYSYQFLKKLEKFYDKLPRREREKFVNFLRSFPYIFYSEIRLGDTVFNAPEHLYTVLLPYNEKLSLIYDEDVGRLIAMVNNNLIMRPEAEHGLIIDLLPISGEGKYIYKGSKPIELVVERSYTIPNPLTGRGIHVREVAVPDIFRFYLY